jgi:carboxypeptidase family protein/TonB-dependent receptor-like protein
MKQLTCLPLLLMASICGIGLAQVGTQSSLTGTVADTTGAGVPNATITATNLSTGTVATQKSSGSGDFTILALPVGSYRVTVVAPSFQRWEEQGVQLTVGNQVRVQPVLKVGAASDTVSVNAVDTGLQTENATVTTVVQMQQIRELPLQTRNPLALVGLTPGMRYEQTGTDNASGMRITYVQGNGLRDNKTNFQLDGVNTNDGSGEGGTAVPNVDSIEQFSVQSVNAGAEAGRDPSQVLVVTKSGTNAFHGSAFEFLQNDIFNAYDAFADKTKSKPRVRYNQFGGTLGGPVYRNRTFFFGSFQATVIRNAVLLNEGAVPAAFFPTGAGADFSSLGSPVVDPRTGQPFPGNVIPASRINSAATYFLPILLRPNSGSNRYIANASTFDKTYEYLGRIDHQLTTNQRIYGRFFYLREPTKQVGYLADPKTFGNNTLHQSGLALNYTWMITPMTLLTLNGGYMRTADSYDNPALGVQNDDELAGIQGIPTTGREKWIGPPDINLNGYTGVYFAGGYGVPGTQKNGQDTVKAAVDRIVGAHTLKFGSEWNNRQAYGGHGSAAPRGSFGFNGQYTGNSFADYLLGYTNSSTLNDPLVQFGEDKSPSLGFYAKDTWKARQNLTFDLGVRYDRYLANACYKNLCSIWNPTDNKVVVAVGAGGKPNFSTYPTSAALAAQTVGLWETTTQAHYPNGLYTPNGSWQPRLGMTYRPFNSNLVLRAGYGSYFNIFTGNRGASIINLPTWTVYSQNYSAATLQKWETVWAAGPNQASNFAVYSPLVNIKPAETREFNISAEMPLFSSTTLTLSYVGTRVPNEISGQERNIATVGYHADLQADLPFPEFSTIHTYGNQGRFWYNGLQAYLERRFSGGLSYTMSYAWSKSMDQNVGEGEFDALLPYAPAAYNRHRTINDYRHLQAATLLWEIPYGHSRRFGSDSNGVVNAVLGGWQASFYEQAHSGQPLTISNTNGNLGNGTSSRANLVSNPRLTNRNAALWFNPSAFVPAPNYIFGNSSVGNVDGPGYFNIDSALAKRNQLTETSYLEFRWEMFNALNHTNLNNPVQNVNDVNLGQIFGSGPARRMQFGLKVIF